jgi:hypothetical protein
MSHVTDYVKSLEAENEKLRAMVEENGLKSGCYDLIMDYLALPRSPSKNVMSCSRVSEKYIELIVPIRRSKNNIFIQKILHDFLEEEKADLGRGKR